MMFRECGGSPVPSEGRQRLLGARGFTLLEVLVSLALVSLLAAVLLQVMTLGLRAQRASQLRTQALEVAGNLLQDFTREEGMRLAAGRRTGTQGPFRYEVVVEPQYALPLEGRPEIRVACYLVRITVAWEEQGRPRSLALTTLRTAAQRG
ncbi:MAG: prepilin-type N-terminal cleavage/methylation domain-containing protein [Syntrophobacterales bacterium]|nr:prepilin-type N-terminal cleavage/methylation domain-containing protein [Syntrophobacterales bacterium]